MSDKCHTFRLVCMYLCIFGPVGILHLGAEFICKATLSARVRSSLHVVIIERSISRTQWQISNHVPVIVLFSG